MGRKQPIPGLYRWREPLYFAVMAQRYPNYLNYLDKLSPRRAFIIKQRASGTTLKEIGKQLGCTFQRVNQLEKLACRQLQWYCTSSESVIIQSSRG
jgi:DNA-directed RNA polymerase sigma subunit (sigma70/sigma32)